MNKTKNPEQKPATTDGQQGGVAEMETKNRDRSVRKEVDDMLQVRKEINEESWTNDKFGPWMIAKKVERKINQARIERQHGKTIKGRKDDMEGGSNRRN